MSNPKQQGIQGLKGSAVANENGQMKSENFCCTVPVLASPPPTNALLTAPANNAVNPSKFPTKAQSGHDEKGSLDDDREWEVVTANEAIAGEPTCPHGTTYSAHFDITLGWGQWKHPLFTCDWSRSSFPATENASVGTDKRRQNGELQAIEPRKREDGGA